MSQDRRSNRRNYSPSEIRREILLPLREIQRVCQSLEKKAKDSGRPDLTSDLNSIRLRAGETLDFVHELRNRSRGDAPSESITSGVRTCLNTILSFSRRGIRKSESLGDPSFADSFEKIRILGDHLLRALSRAPLSELSLPEGGESGAGSEGSASNEEVTPYQTRAFPSPGGAILAEVVVVSSNERQAGRFDQLLRAEGFSPILSEGPEQAMKQAERPSVDLMLIDLINDPAMLQAISDLRSRFSCWDLPIIGVVAEGDDGLSLKALHLGANDCLSSSSVDGEIVARVLNQLSLKREKEDLEIQNLILRKTVGQYLSDGVAEQVLEDPKGAAKGEKRKVTILMSDLRGFTSLSERCSAEEIVEIVNIYLATMTGIIQEFGGTIDEFIGDAILVIFGAPDMTDDDAARAVACAVRMQEAMLSVNKTLRRKGLPEVEMGIGLNTGEVVVGNIGSKRKTKYGVIGRHVNLASRIESHTVGGQILLSDSTLREAGPIVSARERPQIRAKGFQDPVPIHEVDGIGGRFNFYLTRKDRALTPLRSPVEVEFREFDGKVLGEESHRGEMIGLGETAVDLRTRASIPPYTNLALRFIPVDGEPLQEDVHAKSVENSKGRAGVYRLHFTDVPEGALQFLSRIRESGLQQG